VGERGPARTARNTQNFISQSSVPIKLHSLGQVAHAVVNRDLQCYALFICLTNSQLTGNALYLRDYASNALG
jgi:hypothetical protein